MNLNKANSRDNKISKRKDLSIGNKDSVDKKTLKKKSNYLRKERKYKEELLDRE